MIYSLDFFVEENVEAAVIDQKNESKAIRKLQEGPTSQFNFFSFDFLIKIEGNSIKGGEQIV